ncbi:hypothetical protein [Labilibaculum antarcticum]|uniref:HEPN domain-containing protein n=1 Tax=Labilibaculum antarcticum TaxID=1717717 RepID=A0A1Y1CQE4_9BACT|nr:hypothetical protein [Labilibaculum antarcticum]BAX82203.1 hypothetical protein ALGA_3911 [Labilibaculum antarcticum]
MTARKLNWNRWMQDGDQFLKGATPKGVKSILGNTVRYNLLSMSLEGYIMAILDYHHNMPQNHTYSDLIYGLEEVMPIDETLKTRILKYENIQSICSLEKYHRSEPTDEDLVDLFGAIQEISKMAHETCIASI